VIGVEEFVHDSIDIPANHALLDLLGVRTTPTGPDRLLERVRALASSASPPVHELDKWYRQLDQMMATCQPPDAKKIKDAFQAEKLILTENDEWVTAGAVFRSLGEDDIPGTTIVRPSVASLALWQKVGVAERPTVDLVIDWLKTLASGRKLALGDLARVEGVLERHGTRIWVECGHWLNLSDEWVQTTTLRFCLTRQTLAWTHLHDWVKQQTADLRRVPATVAVQEPFSALPLLATQLQDRLVAVPQTQGHPSERPWFTTFATELCRFVGTDDDETTRVRDLARRALATRWHQVADLQMAPYIDGVPAGRARSVDVLWLEQRLYARSGLARAKLAKCVPEEIARPFRIPEIKAALDYSFERSAEDIRDYLNENMKIVNQDDIEIPPIIDGEEIDDTDSERHGGTGATVVIVTPPDSSGERDDLDDLEGLGDDDDPDAGLNPDAGQPTKRAKKPSEIRPSLIERFALALGYKKESVDRYFNAQDGSWIEKTKNDRFPWVRMTLAGDIARYYWPREHCLAATPLELEADLWLLLDSKPTQYALILVDVHGNPIEHTGTTLRRLVDERRLNLYPANYRLVMERQ
ncbi:MAG: ATPase, partial [Chloroflexi bacterium]|nr:ATPase [Chloroflexota bacterium]